MAADRMRLYRVNILLCLVTLSLRQVTSLDVVGKPATQSSTSAPGREAGKAVDGDLSTSTHTAYNISAESTNPWWRLDLEAIYCLRTITIYNLHFDHGCMEQLNYNCALRLEGAVVRAGLNPDRVSNRVIGNVTNEQARNGTVPIQIIANPVVTARYVSVDLPGTNKVIHMREVEVEEYMDFEGSGEVDFILVTNPALLGQTGDNDATIAAYKGPNDISANVSFGRQVITGESDDLPMGSIIQDPQVGCPVIRKLSLPEEGGIDRTGVFYCEASRAGRTNTRIQTVILPKDGNAIHIRPVQRTRFANVGDSVQLEMQAVAAPNTDYRWRRGGGAVLTSWNNQLSVSLNNIAVRDEGVYSCFVSGQEDQQLHGIMRLIVRGCSLGKWGPPACLNVCRRCYNGGVCDASTGSCICAPGFSGVKCQEVHGQNVFGQNAGHRCSNNTDPHNDACRGRLFCLPDPYGCSCAAGFMGLDCMQECAEGKYGADCKQTCHCAAGDVCRKDTGECTSGVCDSFYFGNNCQCSKTEPFTGEVKSNSVMQRHLSFSWSEPKCGGESGQLITGYQYKLSGGASGTQTLLVDITTDTSVLLEELAPYVVYSFQVAAIANGETGMYSDKVVVRTAEAEPTVPLNVAIQTVSEDSITTSWVSPDPPQGRITAYEIAWTLQDATPETQDVGNVLVYTITGLKLNLTYQVQVRAKTEVGPGPWSDFISVTVVGVPRQVQNLRWTTRSDEAVTMDWDPPLEPKGPISGYVVQYREIERPDQPDFTPMDSFVVKETTNAPLVQDNLKPSTEYEFIVSARNLWHMGKPEHLIVSTSSQKGATDVQGSVPTVAAIVIGVLLAIIVAANMIGCVVWRNRNRVRSSASTTPALDDPKIELSVVRDPSIQGIESPIAEGDIYEDVGLPSWAKELEIHWQSLTIEDKVLGKGNFGEVRAGSLNARGNISKIAIKTLKDATSSSSEAFLLEFKTMSQIKPHPNIVALIGACMNDGVLYVALEYLPNGNLRDFLRSTRPQQEGPMNSTEGVSPLTSSNLLTFGIDVARGMVHLSDTGIIHRDLAARNILLGEDLTAKISDFGLSRGDDIYVQKSQTRVPYRWLAIESLTRQVYKSKSDVWSFGIVLWEIATFGATPYPGVQSKVLAKRLQEGYRMPKPENCADEIYDLMMKCWQTRPHQRPSFKEITATLQKMNDPSDVTIYMSPGVYINHVIKPEFDDN